MRRNKFSILLFVCAIVLFVVTIGTGFLLGNRYGLLVMPDMNSRMDLTRETRFDWSVAALTWIPGIFLTLILVFFAEVLRIPDDKTISIKDKTTNQIVTLEREYTLPFHRFRIELP